MIQQEKKNSAEPESREVVRPTPGSTFKSSIEALYDKYEKYAGIAIFGIGFIWDSFTMTRVDNPIDNVILLFYLTIIGIMIVVTLRRQCGIEPGKWIRKIEPHFLWAMQFCFGGLFSSYVIFYFKSASWTRTQFFFLILILLWVGNEFLQHRLGNPVLLATLYCFCLFSFFAFFLPVILAEVRMWIFLLAGFLSLVISLITFALGLLIPPGDGRRRMKPIAAWICATWFTVNVLYFANLIPPVPLALKSAGVYHHIAKTRAGYEVEYVSPPLYRFFRKWDNPFYWSPGESVYCFTAVFAPRKVRVPIVHIWSCKTGIGWVQTDKIRFDISGGRDGGYRGYSRKNGALPGKWRVEVQTVEEGTQRSQILGNIEFTIIPSPSPHPPLKSDLIR
jgi:hypothetical protein